MPVPAMDPNEQAEQYGFSYPPLPPRGLDPNIDRALDMVAAGTSPAIIRELDSWTGSVHFSYSLPDASAQAASAPNSWVVKDGEYVWIDSEGQIGGNIPSWAPPKPNADLETGQYDIQRAVTVQYSGGSQPVTLDKPNYAPVGYGVGPDFRFDPNTGRFSPTSVPQTDAKAGVTTTSSPAGSGTKPETTGNTTGALTMDEQVQSAALAGTGRTDLGWDEWGFYYRQIYGDPAPAPEDRGYGRNADGSVFVGGNPRYPYSVWKDAAFGTMTGPGTPGEYIAPGDTGGGKQNGAVSMNYFLAILAAIVAGDSGWSKYVS